MPRPNGPQRFSVQKLLKMLSDEYATLLRECEDLRYSLDRRHHSEDDRRLSTCVGPWKEQFESASSNQTFAFEAVGSRQTSRMSRPLSEMSVSSALAVEDAPSTPLGSCSFGGQSPVRLAEESVVNATKKEEAGRILVVSQQNPEAAGVCAKTTGGKYVEEATAMAEIEPSKQRTTLPCQKSTSVGKRFATSVLLQDFESESKSPWRSAKAAMDGNNAKRTLNQVRSALEVKPTIADDGKQDPFPVRIFRDTQLQITIIDSFMGFVIFGNMIWIGIDSEIAAGTSAVLAITMDLVFVGIFLVERVLKLLLVGTSEYFFGADKKWNIFESFLVIVSIVEIFMMATNPTDTQLSTPILRILRMGRLAKLVRVMRLKIFKELMLMVNGVIGGVRTLSCSFLLITVPLYVVSLVLRETAGRVTGENNVDASFPNLATSFFTMFRCVVGGDCSDPQGRPVFALLSAYHGFGYAILYIVTVLFMNFGLFNVIVAIYVENTVQAAKANEVALKRARLQDEVVFSSRAKELLDMVINGVGGADNKYEPHELLSINISADFFEKLCMNPRFREILRELDIADEDQLDLFETLDVDGGGTLDLHELIVGIGKLRGDPRRADVIAVSLTLRSLQTNFQSFERHVRRTMSEHSVSFKRIESAFSHTSRLHE
eukprot:TRINITY_DN6375_c1_g1_i1.p1 TRINITY_DN6375_c1_g1~~TRINITY_DN6375_c1_g1_i1.p1  ORF type:complete len:659 (-),score=97.30 TRINITY_DN6375_c1_g1_i1:39-2015(-)